MTSPYDYEELVTWSNWTAIPVEHDEEELVRKINETLVGLNEALVKEDRTNVVPIEIRVTGPQAEHPDMRVVLAETRTVKRDDYRGQHGSR